MQNNLVFGLLICLGLSVAGCATEPRTMTLGRSTGKLYTDDRVKANSPPAACVVHLLAVTDARDDKANLGTFGRSTVVVEDAGVWLSDGLMELKSSAYRVARGLDVPPEFAGLKTVKANVALKQLYVRNVATSRTAHVVATLQFTDADGKAQSPVVLRGANTGVNWVGADGEATGALDLALEELLVQLDGRFKGACGIKA